MVHHYPLPSVRYAAAFGAVSAFPCRLTLLSDSLLFSLGFGQGVRRFGLLSLYLLLKLGDDASVVCASIDLGDR
jgi:hypothetical protein